MPQKQEDEGFEFSVFLLRKRLQEGVITEKAEDRCQASIRQEGEKD